MTKAYRIQDEEYDRKIVSLANIKLSQFNIQREFCLEGTEVPYSNAITCLQQLPFYKTVDAKLNCISNTAAKICSAVPRDLSVGGDELLPLMAYVLIKANIPSVYSEAAFMELFIDMVHQKSIAQEGYVLATYHTALSLIEQLGGEL